MRPLFTRVGTAPRRGRVVAALLMWLVGSAVAGCGDEECRPEPADAIRGYENAAGEVERLLRDVLFWQAYEVLAAGEAQEERARDPGVQQVRRELDGQGIDPAAMTRSEFNDVPAAGLIIVGATREGVIAAQVAEMVERVSDAVHEHAELLPLPEEDMRGWRDDLGRRVNETVAEALIEDSTYRAGVEVAVPGWDGDVESLRLPSLSSPQPEFQSDFWDIVNTIGNDIIREVQVALVAVCENG
jgi:hypothetical protein